VGELEVQGEGYRKEKEEKEKGIAASRNWKL
jgi:hypothetical protein